MNCTSNTYPTMGGCSNNIRTWYRNDSSFTYEFMEYEYDEFTNRYYELVPSCNLSDPDMDGALVRKRISKKTYFDLMDLCKQSFILN